MRGFEGVNNLRAAEAVAVHGAEVVAALRVTALARLLCWCHENRLECVSADESA